MPVGKSLRFYIEHSQLDPKHHHIIMNGGLVAQRDLDTIFPKEGDDIVVRPYIMGGNAGKQILSILVMAAVVVGSILTAGALAGAAPWVIALAVGGITAAGAAITTFALGPSQNNRASDTASYSWNGPQTRAQQGIPIPRPVGKYINPGNVITSYVESINNQQFLNVLLSLGTGPAKAITKVLINGQDIATFANATFDVRLGRNNQTALNNFQKLVNTIGVGQRILAGPGSSSITINGLQNDTEAAEFEFYFPTGLWAGPNSDQSFDSWAVMIQIEYQKVGSPGWNTFIVPGVTNPVGIVPYWIAVVQDYRFDNGVEVIIDQSNGEFEHYQGQTFQTSLLVDPVDTNNVTKPPVTIFVTATWKRNPAHVDNSTSSTGTEYKSVAVWSTVACSFEGNQGQIPERYVFSATLPSKGQYNYRITKLGSNQHAGQSAQLYSSDGKLFETYTRRGEQTWVQEIREVSYQTYTYPNHILLGVRACATNQLSGGNLNISCIVEMDNAETQGYTHAVRWDQPLRYYRLGDGAGTATERMTGATATLARNTASPINLVQNSPSASTLFSSGSVPGLASNFTAVGNFGLEFMFRQTPITGLPAEVIACVLAKDSSGFEMGIDAGGLLYAGNGAQTLRSTLPLHPGKTYHVALSNNSDTNVAVLMSNGAVVSHSTPALSSVAALGFFYTYAGLSGEVAVYDSAPQPARLRKHYLDSLSDHNALEAYPPNIQPMVSMDAITNTLYGAGMSTSLIDVPWYKKWADRCMENVPDGAGGFVQRFQYNGIIDQTATLWDNLTRIAHTGGAGMMKAGFLYSGILDAPGVPRRQFNISNVIKSSFIESWSNADDRANAVDVIYYDEMNNYQRTVLSVQDLNKINAGKKILKSTQVDLRGCTHIARAWHYGNFIVKSSQTLLRSVVFEAPMDSISCWPGEVALIQHDLPEWGEGGKLMAGCTETVLLVDQDLTFDTDGTYLVMLCLKLVPLLENIAVTNIRGDYAYFTGPLLDIDNASRFVFGNQDREILECGSSWVKLDSTDGIVAGTTTAVIFGQNMLIQREVGGYANRVLTLDGALPVAPDEFDTYTYGSVGTGQPTPFHVSGLKRRKDLTAEISFLEYQDSVYTDDIPQISAVQVAPDIAARVTGLLLNENYAPNGEDPTLSISWQNGPATFGAVVYISRNGGPETLLIDAGTNRSTSTDRVFTGDTILIRVVGYDKDLISSGYSSAPTASIIIGGLNNNPSNVSGFGIGAWDPLNNTITLAWNANVENNIVYYSLSFFTNPNANPSAGQMDVAEIARPAGVTAITLAGAAYPGKGTYLLRAVNDRGFASITPATIRAYNLDDVVVGVTKKPRLPGNTPTVTIPPQPFTLTATPGTTIGVAVFNPFIMQTGDQDIFVLTVNYTISGLTQGQGYYFYYDDPNWLGGNVTIHATQDATVLKDPGAQGGRFIINPDKIAVMPTIPSVGNAVNIFRPTASSIIGTVSANSPELAYDANVTTAAKTAYAELEDSFGNLTDVKTSVLTYSNFNPIATTPTSLRLKVIFDTFGVLLEPVTPISVSKVHARIFAEASQGLFSATSGTPVLFTQDFNGLMFGTHYNFLLPGFPDASANITHPWAQQGVTDTGVWDGTRTQITGAGYNAWTSSLNGWQMVLTGHFNIGMAGTIDFMPLIESGWVLGVQGATASAWDRNINNGVTVTPFNGYPVIIGNNKHDNGNLDAYNAGDPFYLNFPTAGQYPYELCYAGGDRDIAELVLLANGNKVIPIEGPNSNIPWGRIDYSPDNGTTWINIFSGRVALAENILDVAIDPTIDTTKLLVRFTPLSGVYAGAPSFLMYDIYEVYAEVGS